MRSTHASRTLAHPVRRAASTTAGQRQPVPVAEDVPQDVAVHTSNPAVDLLYALYFHLT